MQRKISIDAKNARIVFMTLLLYSNITILYKCFRFLAICILKYYVLLRKPFSNKKSAIL
jgi:hypothetical protein